MIDEFVSLHRHDQYSMYDGIGLASRSAKRAAELGQSALALTNHGNVFGLVEHYRACEEVGIKPILGMEAYITWSESKARKLSHITLLVENQKGYENLMRLVTESHKIFWYKPRITLALLEQYKEGLLILSGCSFGLIPRLLEENEELAVKGMRRLAQTFHGQLWVEIQHHETAQKYTPFLIEQAKQLRLPLVATTDAHYAELGDRVVHDLILKMRRKEQGEENPSYGSGYHVLSRKEALSVFLKAYPDSWANWIAGALDETCIIAERVSFRFAKPTKLFPGFWTEPVDRLRRLARNGLMMKKLATRTGYEERLDRELRVIEGKDFSEYFLLCHDVTSWARKHGIMVGPRGSVCGSLLAYCLGITNIDPIEHGTMFERFMHEERETIPDVDLDFDARYRKHVMTYVSERFGQYALPIATFGRYVSGNLSADIAKALMMDDSSKNSLRNLLELFHREKRSAVAEADVDASPLGRKLTLLYPKLPRAIELLYGQVRYIGKHPGGVCFVPGDPHQWLGIIEIKDQQMTSYNYYDVEYLGLVKMDFLGLDAISIISRTKELAERRHEKKIDLDTILLDDDTVYREISAGHTAGVFQLEQRGAAQIAKEIEPENFRELVAVISLNRPGVNAFIPQYLKGKEESRSGKTFPSFTQETYGALVYQEQIMQILRSIGFTWAETDAFMKSIKAVGSMTIKKDIDERQPMRDLLFERLKARGITGLRAERFVRGVSSYLFNKSHGVGYARVTYLMAWLKAHYPLEFWCSLLDAEDIDPKRFNYERLAILDGAILLPPHINGTVGYSIEGNAIRVGLKTLKGVGEKASAEIVAKQPYEKDRDVLRIPRRVVNIRVLKALRDAGALKFGIAWRNHAVRYNQVRAGVTPSEASIA